MHRIRFSPMNWAISCRRNPPSTLRTPISFSRRAEKAIAVFTKLKQANRSTSRAVTDGAIIETGGMVFMKGSPRRSRL